MKHFSPPAVSRPASGAAVDRHENDRQRHTAVINFLGTTKDKRVADHSRGVDATTVKYVEGGEEEGYDYYEEEDYYDYGMSGDFEPRGKAASIGCFLKIVKLTDNKRQKYSTVVCSVFGFSCHVKQTQKPTCCP